MHTGIFLYQFQYSSNINAITTAYIHRSADRCFYIQSTKNIRYIINMYIIKIIIRSITYKFFSLYYC